MKIQLLFYYSDAQLSKGCSSDAEGHHCRLRSNRELRSTHRGLFTELVVLSG